MYVSSVTQCNLNIVIKSNCKIIACNRDRTYPVEDNKLMPGYLDGTYMMDFAKIGKKLARSFKRSEAQKNRNKNVSSFAVVVQSRFSDDFFRNSLNLTESETPVFLNFCEKDPKAKQILTSYTDFELIQFLEQKNKEFKALKKE